MVSTPNNMGSTIHYIQETTTMINDLSIAGVERTKLTRQPIDGHGFTILSYVGLKLSY